MTIVGPAQAACSASAWCDQSCSTPRARSASATSGCSSSGSATVRGRAPVLRGLHDEPLVLPAGGEELVPGLDVADDRHPHVRLDGCSAASTWIWTHVAGAGGSFLHDADGTFTLLGARALEACDRAGAELVRPRRAGRPWTSAGRGCSALPAFIADDVLVLDGERAGHAPASPTPSSATCARGAARARTRSRSGPSPGWRRSSGRCGSPAARSTTRCCGWSSRSRPRVRMAEERGPAAVYEAVLTTLAEGRS